ncbi:MAG TPA: twin-arginine translocation signal domain-containing protein [Anaerolineales bacterium]|nr:twin-arginine translocation signal domain-containing protein [Anaerolineales bacterium]
MNRRDFLKVSGVAALLLSIPAWKLAEHFTAFPVAEFGGLFFRGTPTGEIQVSYDKKQTWQKQVGFSSDLAIKDLTIQSDGRLMAKVDYKGRDFSLTLSDNAKDWLVM